jgi:hypothetical protein
MKADESADYAALCDIAFGTFMAFMVKNTLKKTRIAAGVSFDGYR